MSTEQDPIPVVEPHNWTDGGDKVLILRRINSNGTSSSSRLKNGESIAATPFRWPDGINVIVECDDWDSRQVCGGGLHGWPWGMGLGEGADYDIIDDRWIILAAAPEDVAGNLERGWKCKCRMAIKLYDGPFAGAWAMINGGRHRLIEAMSKGMSDSSKAASSGYSSKAASSGDYSTAASSGDYSKADAKGKDTAAAVVGSSGRVRVGERGAFAIACWNESEGWRFLVGKVGENGIKADTWYAVENGTLVEAKD